MDRYFGTCSSLGLGDRIPRCIRTSPHRRAGESLLESSRPWPSAATERSACCRGRVCVRGHADQPLRLAATGGLPLRWEIASERKIAEGEGTSPLLVLPGVLQNGIFRLRVTSRHQQGSLSEDASLIVCRDRAYQGKRTAPRRMWALGCSSTV